MKIVYQGDIHLRDAAPVNRIDNYYEAQFDKLHQLLKFADDENAVVLLGGDLFDKPNVSAKLLNNTITVFKCHECPVFTILGQHDCLYHNMDIEQSPVGVLDKATVVYIIRDQVCVGEDVWVSGASWEQLAPTPKGTSILLGHISVFKNIPHYWKGEGYTPKTLRAKYPGFNLYLCGDIHEPLVADNVVVSGSMTRLSIDQIDMKPRCYLIDTDTMTITPKFYSIKDRVFTSTEKALKESVELTGLVKALKESAGGRASYKNDCIELAENDTIKQNMMEIFDDID